MTSESASFWSYSRSVRSFRPGSFRPNFQGESFRLTGVGRFGPISKVGGFGPISKVGGFGPILGMSCFGLIYFCLFGGWGGGKEWVAGVKD